MKIKSISDIDKMPVTMNGAEKAYKQTAISSSDDSPNYSFRVFTVEPGGYTPYHQHDYEHVNYIIEGEGEIVDINGKRSPVRKGDFALIMPNEKHQYRNISDSNDFVMICAVPKEHE
jgi:quercetin dioxygenase-like cupin family protein